MLTQMAGCQAADLEQFPDCSDVVRVGDTRWKEKHSRILNQLIEGVRLFLRAHRNLPLKKLIEEYEKKKKLEVFFTKSWSFFLCLFEFWQTPSGSMAAPGAPAKE